MQKDKGVSCFNGLRLSVYFLVMLLLLVLPGVSACGDNIPFDPAVAITLSVRGKNGAARIYAQPYVSGGKSGDLQKVDNGIHRFTIPDGWGKTLKVEVQEQDDARCLLGTGYKEAVLLQKEIVIEVDINPNPMALCELRVVVEGSDGVKVALFGNMLTGKTAPGGQSTTFLVEIGSTVRLEPILDQISLFSHYAGICGGDTQCVLKMDRPREVRAYFKKTCSKCIQETWPALRGAYQVDAQRFYAVGQAGVVLKHDLTDSKERKWSYPNSGTIMNLRSISGSSASSIWAGGENGTLLHFDGFRWNLFKDADGLIEQQPLYAIHAVGTQVLVAGYDGLLLLGRDRNFVSLTKKGEYPSLYAIAARGTKAYVAGLRGTLLEVDMDTGNVKRMELDWEQDLFAIAIHDGGMTVAGDRFVARFDGTRWTVFMQNIHAYVRALLPLAGGSIVLLGERTDNGEPWFATLQQGGQIDNEEFPMAPRPRAILGTDLASLWIFGDTGVWH